MAHSQGSALTTLASQWSRQGPVSADLLQDTREALSAVQPSSLADVAGLVECLLARVRAPESREAARRALAALFDAVRRRFFTRALGGTENADAWLRLLLPAIERSDYALADVLSSREETDPRAVAMRVLGVEGGELTVAEVARRTRSIARGLLSLMQDVPGGKVAILSENSLETALCDLACLTNGIVDFPLPANAVAEQLVYMLRHSGAHVLVASDEEQLAKVLPALPSLPELHDVVVVSRASAERHGLLSLEQVVSQGGEFEDVPRLARLAQLRSRDLATVMYTSGTTGRPKGIAFSHLNVVSKRLCRGFALPHVGEGDVFLCYLPLYHTFGRWLELAGTLWWGATYAFARSTSHGALLEDFKTVHPSVFISVPKKWIELHETAVRQAASDDPEETAVHLRALTGGRLRYGLSAAGYLDPLVFKAFHGAGIELCSGYGMTEATGGVTMTPPGHYLEHSVGKPLPGIECRRADDGELLVRGPYVTEGYFEPTGLSRALDADGWFATGDLVSLEPGGHYRIVGRKKEIYKNRAGQTIAPQRVENLFRDFDAVAQSFLVGDHREYNTLLIWPNYEGRPELRERSPAEVSELLSSLVASANRFLAPFERVVAFQVLPRALDEEHGELTRKGTFKREAVERSWSELIERMYEQKHLSLAIDGATLRIPNWVLREMGVLQHEVALRDGVLQAGSRSMRLGGDPACPGALRIGDLAYCAADQRFDLGALLARPAIWLGNDGLVAFLGEEAFRSLAGRQRRGSGSEIRIDPRLWPAPSPARVTRLLEATEPKQVTLDSLHAAAELLRAERPEARRAVGHLHVGLTGGRAEHVSLSRALLRRAADSPDEEIRRVAFRTLFPHEEAEATLDTLRRFLDRLGAIALRDEDLASLGEHGLSEAQVEVLLASLGADRALDEVRDPSDRRLLVGTMRLLTAHAIVHPRCYAAVRVPLARLSLHGDDELAARASEELDRLRRGFSNWVGPNLRLAIEPATGAEYGWKDVVAFEHGIGERARELLLRAIADTTLIRASVFLFGHGVLISLADIPPGGATVTHLGAGHGKSVYRLSLHTRAREAFDIAINLVSAMHPAELREEISWLLAAGAPPPLVEAFGGYYPEYGIFTEEYIPGVHVGHQVERFARHGEEKRLKGLWPYFAWSALSAHIAFWDRAGRRVALREPSPEAFIVPSHDYHSGTRLVSVSDRSPCATLDELLDRFQEHFVNRVEASRPELQGEVTDEICCAAVVEALGLPRARALLEVAARMDRRGPAILAFLAEVREHGYTPQRIHFAARRYARWLEVNPAATKEARGAMLGELWGTYRLAELEQTWPDTRVRFFRQTVFAGARPEFKAALERLMQRARTLPTGGLDLEEQVAANRAALQPTAEEDYFLARMTYRYLSPSDETKLISLPSGDRQITEVVIGLRDEEGNRYWIRGPASPREVARLLQTFHDANLAVNFTAEHEYLIALDSKDVVLGGVFYRWLGPDRVQMEKIAVARGHRGVGIADGLMRELIRRLKARGVTSLETGYYQPDYLRRYGFRTNPTSGGLVATLRRDPGPLPASWAQQ